MSQDSIPPSLREDLLRVTDGETLLRTATLPGAPMRRSALSLDPTAEFLGRIPWDTAADERALPTATLLRLL